MKKHWLILLIMNLFCLSIYSQTEEGSLHLFNDFMKKDASPIVYDFLERYLYKVSHSTRGYDFYQSMADDKVVVRDGSLDNISKLADNVTFSIVRYEDKGYDACWKDLSGKVLLEMQFPLQFELLLGQPKVEIEKGLKILLESEPDSFSIVCNDSLLVEDNGTWHPANVSHYYVESLNTASYYSKVDSTFIPIYSSEEKWYSAANLFQGHIDNINDYRMHIEQTLYGFKQDGYNIKLSQWLNYCKENQLVVYFGIEEEREDGLKALLIAHNNDLGYNHLMSIILPDNFIDKRNAILKVKLNAYIPTDNVKDLYQEHIQKKNEK